MIDQKHFARRKTHKTPRRCHTEPDTEIHVYISEGQFSGSPMSQMTDIRAAAAQNNVELGIRSALLFQGGWFVQWLEGPSQSIRSILTLIEPDSRHCHVQPILNRKTNTKRLLEPWLMTYVQTDESNSRLSKRLKRLCATQRSNPIQDPLALWRHISRPIVTLDEKLLGQKMRVQRVMMCSSQPSLSFSMLETLGVLYDVPVVQQRAASIEGPDVAANYVDYRDHARMIRVMAMSHTGLSLGAARTILPDQTHVILLLDGDPKLGSELMIKLINATKSIFSRPTIIGLSPNSEEHRQLFYLARQSGFVYIDVNISMSETYMESWERVQPLLLASTPKLIPRTPTRWQVSHP